ncbi:hypothetical protein ACHAWU_005706 [Discostella pseudostelligera]|uniref:ABC transporter domain-containing protein n=1 Tax=Discostella pseudostelligera TaxID=259834 RepID=A0ABD3MQZ8_9STRA
MSITTVSVFAFLCIIRPEPRWNPQYVIPICGMFMGHCISGVRLTVNHLSTQIMEGGRREIELYLSFGASGWQSVRRLVNEAVGAGVTPLLNSLNVIGLVSIPGERDAQVLIEHEYWNNDGTDTWRLACNRSSTLPDSYHVSDCNLYFCPIFLNLFIVYCVEVVGKKQKQKQEVIGITQRMVWGLQNWIYPIWSRQQYLIGNSEIQPLENASINETTNRIQILTRQFASHDSETEPFVNEGEITIVRGPSGCGKSSLLHILAGLSPMDDGNVVAAGQSLATCSGRNGRCMVQWRTNVRYVTQHKADLPGSPRDFILRIQSFYSQSTLATLSEDKTMTQTISNLQHWGMGEKWKTLLGGESQQMLLAIAMASHAKVLLLDEATTGLDNETEKLVEESIVEYAKKNGAAVLWVTHNDDIVERLLSRQC